MKFRNISFHIYPKCDDLGFFQFKRTTLYMRLFDVLSYGEDFLFLFVVDGTPFSVSIALISRDDTTEPRARYVATALACIDVCALR